MSEQKPEPQQDTNHEEEGPPAARVDSVLVAWGSKLQQVYRHGIEQEFVSRGIAAEPFHDAATFATSIRALVARYKESGDDPSAFVNDVWRSRIDREWRESLVKPALLGRTDTLPWISLSGSWGAR